jgi:hypothetical protein
MTTIAACMKTIEKCLDSIPLAGEKAKPFYSYVFQRTLTNITLPDEKTLGQAVLACIDRVGKSDFPLIKPNGKVLLIPVGLILEDLLYTDMQMTVFFINFLRFHLLLTLVHTLYPDLFEKLSRPPYLVPAALPTDHGQNADAVLFDLGGSPVHGPFRQDDRELSIRHSLVRSLSGCAFLPLGAAYGPFLAPIFEAFQVSP